MNPVNQQSLMACVSAALCVLMLTSVSLSSCSDDSDIPDTIMPDGTPDNSLVVKDGIEAELYLTDDDELHRDTFYVGEVIVFNLALRNHGAKKVSLLAGRDLLDDDAFTIYRSDGSRFCKPWTYVNSDLPLTLNAADSIRFGCTLYLKLSDKVMRHNIIFSKRDERGGYADTLLPAGNYHTRFTIHPTSDTDIPLKKSFTVVKGPSWRVRITDDDLFFDGRQQRRLIRAEVISTPPFLHTDPGPTIFFEPESLPVGLTQVGSELNVYLVMKGPEVVIYPEEGPAIIQLGPICHVTLAE